MISNFEKEQKLFLDKKQEWLRSKKGQFAWIHESEAEFFNSYDQAVEAAYSSGFAEQPIFIKKIVETDTPLVVPIHFFTDISWQK